MKRTLKNLTENTLGVEPMGLEKTGLEELFSNRGKVRVNIIAMGDVGTNLLMGLKLLGGDVISEIGIYDLNQEQLKRLELEFNQMHYPPNPSPESLNSSVDPKGNEGEDIGGQKTMPKIHIVGDAELLNCDVLIFCATKGVPAIGEQGDMRMAQLKANLGLVSFFGEKIRKDREEKGEAGFNGFVAVVSDPVDQLCMGMLLSSGLEPGQVRGFGLGVMAARARYYAERDERFSRFLTEGRAFGPHGQYLVIADSVTDYNDELSKELTKLAVEANMRVRDLGFKPFLAPAISSAAISILMTLRGRWNYGSMFFGNKVEGEYKGSFLGVLSRLTEGGAEYEDWVFPEALYDRIKEAYLSTAVSEDDLSDN